MRRTQIDALMDAHRGRVQPVVSLHVLRQATLDDDDQHFLREHARALELGDLLRWLGRSSAASARGAILRELARVAIEAPERFRFEVLGSGKGLLDEHEWGEVLDLSRGRLEPALEAEIWAKVGGAPTFRALCRGAPWAPGKPLEDSFFACDRLDGERLEGRVARAFEPRGVRSLQVAGALFACRYDEAACQQALRRPGAGVDPARWAFELERAGLEGFFCAAGLPAETAWTCEGRGDEDAQVRQAYLRHAALAHGGEGGLGWLVGQVEAALERGVAPAALLAEAPLAVRERLPGRLVEKLRGCMERMPLRSALALGALVPGAVDEAALARRAAREADGEQDDWGPLVALLPAALEGAALARARRSMRGPELVALLDWLSARGKSRKVVLDLAVAALERGLLHRALIGWLAGQFATRAAWEQGGAEVLGSLVRSEALPEINDLLAVAWSQARRERDDDAEPPAGFRQAVHCAFAEALLDAMDGALARGDRRRALPLASALACLDPPSRFGRRLCAPGRPAATSDEVEHILDVVRSLTRHGGGRDATLRDAIAAVHALASLEEPDGP